MLLSIIIPAFNCEKSIERTVNSIISSGLRDYEIIIINDGSTDDTESICKNLCSRYSLIKYHEQENEGVSAARNMGITLSAAEYIMFFDADDTAKENGFSECVDIIRNEKPDMLVFGMSFDYYKNGKCYRRDELAPEQSGLLDKSQIRENLESLYNTNSLTPVWNKFFKRSLINDNNISFNTNYHLMEDFLFSLECLRVCENIYCFPKALYQYKQSENEKNAFNRLDRIEDLCEYTAPFKKALEALNAGEVANKVFNNFFFMLLYQKMYYLNKKELKALIEGLNSNSLFSEFKQSEVSSMYMGLLKDIKEFRYIKIRFLNLKTQLRHRVAVFVKSIVGSIKN